MELVAYPTTLLFQLLLVSKIAGKYPKSPIFLVKVLLSKICLCLIFFFFRAAANIYFTAIKPIDSRGRSGPHSSVEL